MSAGQYLFMFTPLLSLEFAFFIAALFTATTGPLVLLGLYLLSFCSAFLVAWLMGRDRHVVEPFILEMPPYRLPALAHIWQRGWNELRHFLRRATRFIVLGVVLVWALTHMPFGVEAASAQSWAGIISQKMAFLPEPLGIDPHLSIALVFGFVAKEIVIGSLAVIYNQEGSALTSTIAQQIDGHRSVARWCW